MAEPQIQDMTTELAEVSAALKRAIRHHRQALQNSNEAENRLREIATKFGIEVVYGDE